MRPLLVCLVLTALTANAAPTDPLKAPECAQAIEALEQARGAARNNSALATRFEPLRQQAAFVCLGASSIAKRSARVAQPPAVIAPSASPPPPTALGSRPALAAPASPRPGVVAQCDAGGCWDSDGTRLQRAGPNLIGPRGLCTLQGSWLNCP